MTDRFIAIAVKRGDAFFFECNGSRMLIDGGSSRKSFPSQFRTSTNCDGVDILVCTHNDSDHAMGIVGFLESGLSCSEVWLPASWLDRISDLLGDSLGLFAELSEDIRKQPPETEMSLAEIGNEFVRRDSAAQDATGGQEADIREMFSAALQRVSDCDGFEASVLLSLSRLPIIWPWPLIANQPWSRTWIEAIAAGDRIRRIAISAYNRGVKVRWFEYVDNTPSGGEPKTLVPLNAREVSGLRVRQRGALEYLALTIVNQRSLVFHSRACEQGVLFSADSDLTFATGIPWSAEMIVTTPHHGSDENQKAYDRFNKEVTSPKTITWVRSDEWSRKRPGTSYLTLPCYRYCTICRGSSGPKRDVYLPIKGSSWQRTQVKPCCCI